VWLDRGELDKIIEASHQPEPRGKYGDRGPARPSQGVPQKPYSSQVGRKKKSGFGGLLDDIFDF
jgi:Zn-finger nucleic acid-binding protein